MTAGRTSRRYCPRRRSSNTSTGCSPAVSHNKANINRTHDQSFEELRRIRESFPELQLCIGMATTFGCPFEGIPDLDKVLRFVERIRSCDVDTVYLADTIGIADPAQVRRTVKSIIAGRLPLCPRRLRQHRHGGSGLHAPANGLRYRHRL